MKFNNLAAVTTTLALLVMGGCAGNDAAVSKDQVAAMLKPVQSQPSPEEPTKPKNVTNAIVAVVNDEIITLYDVNREAQLPLAEAAKKGADPRHPGVACGRHLRPGATCRRCRHGPELEDSERPAVPSHPLLTKEHAPGRIGLDRDGNQHEQRREQQQAEKRGDEVEQALGHAPVAPSGLTT